MTNQITTFNFHNHPIHTINDNGEIWFRASDIANALRYGNHRQAIKTHVDSDDVQFLDTIDSMGRTQQSNYINESGMYALIFGSKKPEAKRFKRWVTAEVLPQIRQTGSYGNHEHLIHQNQILKTELLKQNADYHTIKVMYDAGLDNPTIARAVTLARSTIEKRLTHMRRLGLISERGITSPSQQLSLEV